MTYASTILADSPVAYWRLGESSGSAVDQTANANTGTYGAGVTLGVTGIAGGGGDTAITLSGAASQDMSVATPSAALANLGDILSIEAWVKRTATQSVNQSIYEIASPGPEVRFNGSNQIELLKANTASICTTTATLTDTASWHHIVVTKSGATIHVYLDGVDKALGTNVNSTLANSVGQANIGSNAHAAEWFNGSLDEVAIYNVALSQAQVTAHYNAGTVVSQISHVTSIVANASTWTDQAGSSVSADLVTALDDNTATYIKSPGNPAGSGPITIHTGPLSKPNAGDRNFIVGLQKSANTGTMDYTVECKKSGGASVQTFNKDGSAGATLVAALGNVASAGGTATCTVTNAIADADWANGFDWVVTPNKSA